MPPKGKGKGKDEPARKEPSCPYARIVAALSIPAPLCVGMPAYDLVSSNARTLSVEQCLHRKPTERRIPTVRTGQPQPQGELSVVNVDEKREDGTLKCVTPQIAIRRCLTDSTRAGGLRRRMDWAAPPSLASGSHDNAVTFGPHRPPSTCARTLSGSACVPGGWPARATIRCYGFSDFFFPAHRLVGRWRCMRMCNGL